MAWDVAVFRCRNLRIITSILAARTTPATNQVLPINVTIRITPKIIVPGGANAMKPVTSKIKMRLAVFIVLGANMKFYQSRSGNLSLIDCYL